MISKELEYALAKCRSIPYVKGQVRVYSVIRDKRGKIVSESANSYTKTSRRQFEVAKKLGHPEKICLHAESGALFKSKGKGCKIYVARIDSKGDQCLAKPCKICEFLIKEHGGIKSVEYTV